MQIAMEFFQQIDYRLLIYTLYYFILDNYFPLVEHQAVVVKYNVYCRLTYIAYSYIAITFSMDKLCS